MLYISRYIGPSFFGVVDTDDWKESIVDLVEINNDCYQHGVRIEGVDTTMLDRTGRIISAGIKPYQPPSTLTRQQMKLKMLQCVDIKIFRDSITHISWAGEHITSPVTVRLSDFGSKVCSYVFGGNKEYGSHKVTLVLDDRCRFTDESFACRICDDSYVGVKGIGVVFDIRELSYRPAKHLHDMFYGERLAWEESVIDLPDRKRKWTW